MRFIPLLLTVILIGTCRQDDEHPLPCGDDHAQGSFVLDYTPRYFSSEMDASQYWGFISDSDGNVRTSMRLGVQTPNRLYLEKYCSNDMDFTFCSAYHDSDNRYRFNLRTIRQVNSYEKLSEPYNRNYKLFNGISFRIKDLPDDVERVYVEGRSGQRGAVIDEESRIAQINLNNFPLQESVLVKVKRTNQELDKSFIVKPLHGLSDISYDEFQDDVTRHVIHLPHIADWAYSVVGILDDDLNEKVTLKEEAYFTAVNRLDSIVIEIPQSDRITEFLFEARSREALGGEPNLAFHNTYAELPERLEYEPKLGEYNCLVSECGFSVDSDFSVVEGVWIGNYSGPNGEEITLVWNVFMPAQSETYKLPDFPENLLEAFPVLDSPIPYRHYMRAYSFAPEYNHYNTVYEFMGKSQNNFWREQKGMISQILTE